MKRLDKLCGNCAIWRQIPQNPAAPDEGVSGWCHLIPKPQEKRVGHFCSEWRGENGERHFDNDSAGVEYDFGLLSAQIDGLKEMVQTLNNRLVDVERKDRP